MPRTKHLDTFSIRGYRGLRHVGFENLGQVNLIVGENDVGKTSVLEAVFLTTGFAVLPLPVFVQNQRRHLVHDSRDLLLLFHDLNVHNGIKFIATTPIDERQLQISAEPESVVIDQDIRASSGASNGEGRRLDTTSYLSKPDVPYALRYSATLASLSSETSGRHYAGTLSITDDEIKMTDDDDAAPLRDETTVARMLVPGLSYDSKIVSEVLVDKKLDRLIEYLRAVNPRIDNITVSGNIVYVDIGLDRMVPISMCGSGLVRTAQVLSACLSGGARILLIDEIGNGLHHSAIGPVLTAIITVCKQQSMQVFFTTHSLEVMQCMRRALASDSLATLQSETACFVMARDKDSHVRTYRYSYEQFDHVVSHGIEIR